METLLDAQLGIIDTHCHLWKIELAQATGLTPDFGPIFRTFDPTDLSREALPCRVEQCVLIEAGKTDEENRVMAEMVASSSLIGAFAPHIEIESPTLAAQLDGWCANPKFRGVRTRFEGHPDPNILKRVEITQGLREVAARGLRFEFLVRAEHLRDILPIYEAVPNLKAVIEHMAKPDVAAGTDRDEWQTQMKALARDTSVVCKVSLSPRVEQMGDLLRNLGQGWPVERIKPYVQFLLEHFGPKRLMWGSDWPIAMLVSGYGGTLDAMRAALGPLPAADEAQIFRHTAMEFYGVR
jgi:L-fuconolactonase